MFDFYVDKNPLYTCSTCGAEVTVTVTDAETIILRSCEHTSVIHANVAARVLAKGGIIARIEHAFKTAVSQDLTALLGRSVVWR